MVHLDFIIVLSSCGFCVKERKQTTGKNENNTVKHCPAPHRTSAEGTFKNCKQHFSLTTTSTRDCPQHCSASTKTSSFLIFIYIE